LDFFGAQTWAFFPSFGSVAVALSAVALEEIFSLGNGIGFVVQRIALGPGLFRCFG
jgi:hypothetical protein